jgi:hypothetical protein
MRDLDELLDPVVSRKASAAARTPDFAAVERRGQQRRRRARAAAVGAVIAIAAVVSVIGAQVASYRSDTAPAGTIEWDGPDGELARMAESGEADGGNVMVGADGSVLMTWSHQGPIDPDANQSPFIRGVSLTADGKTYWSPLNFDQIEPARLGSGGFVVALTEKGDDLAPFSYYVADENNVRPLELSERPADLASGDYDGYAYIYATQTPKGAIWAVDADSASAAPVSQLTGVVPDFNNFGLDIPQTDDGEVWVIAHRPGPAPKLVHMASDGQLNRYPLPARLQHWPILENLIGISASADGRPILLWADGEFDANPPVVPRPLKLTTVTASGAIRTVDLGMIPGKSHASAAALPDGRLLVNNSAGPLRSSDESWQDFERIAPPDGMRAGQLRHYVLAASADSVCLTSSPYFGTNQSGSGLRCTEDGESWHQVDLAP